MRHADRSAAGLMRACSFLALASELLMGCATTPAETPAATSGKVLVQYDPTFRGLVGGVSRLEHVQRMTGLPGTRTHERRWAFDGFDVTFEDGSGRLNTIIVHDPTFVDTTGLRVGIPLPDDWMEHPARVRASTFSRVDFQHGLIYWLDERGVIMRIVLARRLAMPEALAPTIGGRPLDRSSI